MIMVQIVMISEMTEQERAEHPLIKELIDRHRGYGHQHPKHYMLVKDKFIEHSGFNELKDPNDLGKSPKFVRWVLDNPIQQKIILMVDPMYKTIEEAEQVAATIQDKDVIIFR